MGPFAGSKLKPHSLHPATLIDLPVIGHIWKTPWPPRPGKPLEKKEHRNE
jgi:hypothetical protein